MKKFNIKLNSLATIALTCITWLCIFIAAAFVLQADACPSPYYDILGCLMYLGIAIFFEWIKYKVTHKDE